MVLYGVEGWGKTSFAAYAPKPYFLMASGETGLETLIDAGQLPEIPHYPELETWGRTLEVLDMLANDEHDYKTLVLDAMSGFERLCHNLVCARDYNNDWTEKGFVGFQRGAETALEDWRLFLSKLDTIRNKRRMGIVLIGHASVVNFKNPLGPDYDKYSPDVNKKTWAMTAKWADMILFGNYITVVDNVQNSTKANPKGKAKGGSMRTLYTQQTAAYVAKNRFGLSDEIDMGTNAEEAFQNFINAIKAAKEVNNG